MAIQSFTLDNGMQVLLEENHAAKVVSFNALAKVGSVNETDDEAGISHLIEHMLFKGTPTRPAGIIARDVEAAGGDINAYTSLDQTVYYINMASRFSKQGLEILADAIQNPLFDAEELAREKEVVLEEVRREQDNPSRMTIEHLFQSAYKAHTYGRPIIGFQKRSSHSRGMMSLNIIVAGILQKTLSSSLWVISRQRKCSIGLAMNSQIFQVPTCPLSFHL